MIHETWLEGLSPKVPNNGLGFVVSGGDVDGISQTT